MFFMQQNERLLATFGVLLRNKGTTSAMHAFGNTRIPRTQGCEWGPTQAYEKKTKLLFGIPPLGASVLKLKFFLISVLIRSAGISAKCYKPYVFAFACKVFFNKS